MIKQKCLSCGSICEPNQTSCPKCGSLKFKQIKISMIQRILARMIELLVVSFVVFVVAACVGPVLNFPLNLYCADITELLKWVMGIDFVMIWVVLIMGGSYRDN